MLKIILSLGLVPISRKTTAGLAEELSNSDYQFTVFDHRASLDEMVIADSWLLDRLYWRRDKRLFGTYDRLNALIRESGADVLMVGSDNVYHPEFVKGLDVYTVLMSTDDPDSSYPRTVPYVWAFDHVTCCAVRYHEALPVKMTDKLVEWGAKRASWQPLGVTKSMFNPTLTEQDILQKERPIDLIYCGGAYREKIDALMKLKQVFGRRFHLYGRWNWKPHAYGLVKYRNLMRVRPLSAEDFVPAYQNTKIGINMHQSGELGNGRLYQLPVNGIMQICDCADVLGEVFEPGKEIVGYRSLNEAIELIKYYLQHDDERKKIAAAGFRKAIANFTITKSYYSVLEDVKRSMLEDGVRRAKDGSVLTLEGAPS